MTSYSEVPVVIVKPGKMFGGWTHSARVLALLAATMICAYVLLFLKTLYLKDGQLDQIAIQAMNTEQLLKELKNLDQQLAADIETVRDQVDGYTTI